MHYSCICAFCSTSTPALWNCEHCTYTCIIVLLKLKLSNSCGAKPCNSAYRVSIHRGFWSTGSWSACGCSGAASASAAARPPTPLPLSTGALAPPAPPSTPLPVITAPPTASLPPSAIPPLAPPAPPPLPSHTADDHGAADALASAVGNMFAGRISTSSPRAHIHSIAAGSGTANSPAAPVNALPAGRGRCGTDAAVGPYGS